MPLGKRPNPIIRRANTAPPTSTNTSCPAPATSRPTISPYWNAPPPTPPSVARARARCAPTRCCPRWPTLSTTPSACASTNCPSPPKRSCAASAPTAAPARRRGADMAIRRSIVGIDSPDRLTDALRDAQYLADDGLATAAYLALALGKPLLLEGAPGVGKTEGARALASVLGRQVVRLQCYEGIDAAHALYEWNYPRQMLAIRQAGDNHVNIYADDFLIRSEERR